MQVLAHISLNFQQPNYLTVYAAQNDRLSRYINAQLLDGSEPWTLPGGGLMTIRYRKPDGTSGFYDTLEDGSPAYNVESDGSITFGLAEQALTVPGAVPVELNFYNAAGSKLSTLTFIVAVKPSAYSDEDIASSDYYNILTAKMQQLAELADSAEGDYQEYLSALSGFVGAPRTAAVAADMLDTGLIYVYTGSETGWTYGDWYYYNGREWTSGGVYNSAAISLDDTLTNANKPAQAKAAGDLVLVQDTQPSAPVNKLWFPLTDPEDEQVPTWDEFSELKSSVDDVKTAVNRDLFASAFEPLGREYYAANVFSLGYITAAGAEAGSSTTARSVYFQVPAVRAVRLPLACKIKFVWFSAASASGILGRDDDYQPCGPDILNYVLAPENAQFFRMQLVKNDGSAISSSDLAEAASGIVLYAAGGAAARDRAMKQLLDLSYNRQLAGKTAGVTFDLIKGSTITGSSGSASSDAKYVRTAIFPMRLDSFRFTCPDGYAANVSFYNAMLVQASKFIGKQTLRYEGSSYLIFPPASTAGAVVEFHRKDWAAMTDDDVAALAAGFKVYASSNTEIPAIPEADARAAFVAYMNETCDYLGLSNSAFVNASGLDRSNSSCPLDELKLAIAVAGNPLACDLWSTKDRAFHIGGANPRTISVVNNVYGADREGHVTYKLLGGKGGSLNTPAQSYYRKARIGLYDVNGTPVAVALMGPGEWNFNNMSACIQDLLDMMSTKLSGNTPVEGTNLSQLISNGGGYIAVPVPNVVQAYRNSYTPSELLTRANVLHNNDTASQTPASTTKTVTMLCALRVASDLQEVITINSTEANVGGSGSTFSSGDKVTLEEALRIMMMESSNTMAEAIGRVIGIKLLLTRSAKG